MALANESKMAALGVSGDKPKVDPIDDAFAYAPFAQLLANAIVKTPNPQGLVLALNAPAGAGKSTVLNFVKFYLQREARAKNIVLKWFKRDTQGIFSPPLVVDFNPWWFNDRRYLAMQLLGRISAQLAKFPALRRISALLSSYIEVVDPLARTLMPAAMPASNAVPANSFFKLVKLIPRDLATRRAEIEKALRRANQRIVVVIDEIDRLMPEEIREVFRVIKTLADFPNTVYLLAFDRQIIVDALNQIQGLDGDAYLEKIVQVPFVLPAIEPFKLREKLLQELNQLGGIAMSQSNYPDADDWHTIFEQGIARLITTPRDLIRYIDALSMTFPPLKEEVNATDFFALELLRLKFSSLYNLIKENPQRFVAYSTGDAQSIDSNQKFHDGWKQALDKSVREPILAIINTLFPNTKNVVKNQRQYAQWAVSKRIAHASLFPRYFCFQMSTDLLSHAAIQRLVENLSDSQLTQQTLYAATTEPLNDGRLKIAHYLEQLTWYELEPQAAITLLNTLAKLGDDFLRLQGQLTLLKRLLIEAIAHVLSFVPENVRDEKLLAAFRDSKKFIFLSALICHIERPAKSSDYYWDTILETIKPSTWTLLKETAVIRINELKEGNRLFELPNLVEILSCWERWESPTVTERWIAQLFENRARLIGFVRAILGETERISLSKIEGLSNFVDLDKVAMTFARYSQEKSNELDSHKVMHIFDKAYRQLKLMADK